MTQDYTFSKKIDEVLVKQEWNVDRHSCFEKALAYFGILRAYLS